METREVDIDQLPISNKRTCLQPGELVTGIEANFTDFSNVYFKKLARRRHDDICAISCACNFKVEANEIKSAKICFGKMDEITVHMKPLEAYFNNLKVKEDV